MTNIELLELDRPPERLVGLEFAQAYQRFGSRVTAAGFMKVLVEAVGDRILGFAMIGPEAE